jgi:uncharacterized paraquat-inducible protein A
MFEIIGLVVACTAIATLARGRGASPVLAVGAAVGGWVMIEIGGGLFLPSGDYRLVLILSAWGWVALVAGFVRFVIGAGRPKPDSKWSCSNCHYLNNASAVICEACTQPWRSA